MWRNKKKKQKNNRKNKTFFCVKGAGNEKTLKNADVQLPLTCGWRVGCSLLARRRLMKRREWFQVIPNGNVFQRHMTCSALVEPSIWRLAFNESRSNDRARSCETEIMRFDSIRWPVNSRSLEEVCFYWWRRLREISTTKEASGRRTRSEKKPCVTLLELLLISTSRPP